MAMNQQQQADKNDEEITTQEKKIPVFTVLKNNSILKNIFLLDNPSSSSSQEEEETLVVGRHPDCNITLDHLSISRFHLRIHFNPSSRSLSVTDLSSVHGTWVSGKKIESGVRVELNDGDTLRLGGSSRMYSLHWIPLSCPYDLENPFLPPLDESEPVEESEEEGDQQSRTLQNIGTEEESKGRTEQTLTLDDNDFLEGLYSLFSDVNMIPSAPPLPEDVSSLFYGEDDDDGLEHSETSKLQHSSQINKENFISATPCTSEEYTTVTLLDSPESPPVRSVQKSARSIWSRRGKPSSVHIETASCNKKSASHDADSDLVSVDHDNHAIQSISKDLFPCLNVNEEEELFTPNKENHTPDTQLCRLLNMTGQEKMKNESILRFSVSIVDGSDGESFTPNKENMTPNTVLLRSMKKMGKLGEIKNFNLRRSSPLKNVIGPKIFCENHVLSSLDSENQTTKVVQEQNYTSPTSSKQVRSVIQRTAPKRKAERVPFQSLHVESTSEPKVKATDPNDSTRSQKPENLHYFDPIHNGKSAKENNRWTMVVDTASLVNKDSRKALQLLQGLKGTNLIIPRIVVRELDCMNRRDSFFKTTTKVSSALQWIEDCMVNTKGWIHVQSSAEEVRLTAPTPPVTPLPRFRDEKDIFSTSVVPFSPANDLLEIVSPTAQDHVLECALFYRGITDGHLVLLSEDVTLKIKAMAEGLLCETAEQFRESLTNPFSERFMWTGSSPRGLTWSSTDDVVLREKFYNGPLQKPSKSGEGVKGLKLILLHNTHYRQRTTSFINN